MSGLLQFPSVLAVSCLCALQLPSAGFSQPSADPPDARDVVPLQWLAYRLNRWATLSNQPKDDLDLYKRFLFHYSGMQEPAYPVKNGPPPAKPPRLAARLGRTGTERRVQQNLRSAPEDLSKKDPTAALGRPFFLFRPRNGRNVEVKAP